MATNGQVANLHSHTSLSQPCWSLTRSLITGKHFGLGLIEPKVKWTKQMSKDYFQSGMDPRSLLAGLRLLRQSGLWSTNKKMSLKTPSSHQPASQEVVTECASVDPSSLERQAIQSMLKALTQL